MTTPLEERSLPPLPAAAHAERDIKALETYLHGRSVRAVQLPVALFHTFCSQLIKVFGLSIIALISSLLSPLLLRQVILGLERKVKDCGALTLSLSQSFGTSPEFLYPVLCSFGLFLNSICIILAIHHLLGTQFITALRCRAALNALVFEKALRQKRASHQDLTSGFIVNLVGTDSLKVQTFVGFMHSLWYHSAQLLIVNLLLYRLIGYSALLGSASLFLFLGVSVTISRRQSRIRKDISRIADRRVGLTHESLVHIKAAKFQGWEENLARKISELRLSEVALGRSLARLSAIASFTSGSAPAIAMAITCGVAIMHGITLDAATVFPMLALFMMLRFALNNLPDMIFNLVDAGVALGRIRTFLNAPEFIPAAIAHEAPAAVEISSGVFCWSEGRTAISIPHLSVERGELVVVMGSIGSGKSALLLSILGELEIAQGTVSIGGRLGYAAQSAWIVSDSIRGNIVSGQPYDQDRYKRAIRASGLEADLAALPYGDTTEIGERGINLSGGQRHRVALARLFYAGAEIYLLDDPLSALDPSVANHVFRELLCREMASATRILVSHRVEFALLADRVVVVENNTIIEEGPPHELQRTNTRFSELLRYHHEVTGPEQPHERAEEVYHPISIEERIDTVEHPTGSAFITAEERQVGQIAPNLVKEYAKRLAPGFAVILLFSLFIGRQLAAVSTDVWLARTTSATTIDVRVFLGVYLALVFVLCVFVYRRAMFLLTRGLAAGVACHNRLLEGVLRAPMRFFESNPVGRIINRFSRDLETVELALPRTILDAGHCLFETLSVVLVTAFITPITIVILAPASVAYFHLQKMFRPVSREGQRLASVTLSPIFALLSESLSGIETLRASNLVAVFKGRFLNYLDAYTRVTYTQTICNRWIGIHLELLGSCVILGVGLSASLALDTTMGTAFSGLALSYATTVTAAMNWAIRSISLVESNLTSFERMERYASTPSEKMGGKLPPAGWPTAGQIRMCNLSVRYRPDLAPVLSRITVTIPGGSRVGIIGRTGSGKSTLVMTIMRLLEPSEGYIEIDGENLSLLTLSSIRGSIAIVSQEPVLFSGTLRESLDPFASYRDDEIHQALERVRLSRFVASLPDGLQTPVKEGGFNFSGGQRQLICLARALLRKSRVIILDEATAAIDVETDFAIQRTIREEFSGCTLLVIAHRLGTVLDSDLILALRDGQLVESGPPAELLSDEKSLLSEFIRELQSNLRKPSI